MGADDKDKTPTPEENRKALKRLKFDLIYDTNCLFYFSILWTVFNVVMFFYCLIVIINGSYNHYDVALTAMIVVQITILLAIVAGLLGIIAARKRSY
mmetsp:Transcript_29927/g.27395  ORF Transcript_29927/g.27395 Transcript_29927/m.27395 type:complete len:97 (+) Transcript_29927:53-343(+)